MCYWRKEKKYASELERKVSIYKRKKMKGFAQGSKKIFGLFLFYHLSWFLAGPFYWIIEKKKKVGEQLLQQRQKTVKNKSAKGI